MLFQVKPHTRVCLFPHETYGALFDRSDRFLVECARECIARTLRLEQSMALLPRAPPRVPLSSSELLFVASF